MGLSTHVLDTMHGGPAAGMEVALYTTDGDAATLVKRFTLNSDGRSDGPLYDNDSLKAAPFPAATRLGAVTWTDTWLWDKSGRFQLDTLTEGQQQGD